MNYYENFKNKLGYIYSLDMVRLNYILDNSYSDQFTRFIEAFSIQHGVKVNYYQNHKGIGYRYLWSITIEDEDNFCSFVVGRQLNYKSENKNSGFIEFNPNKCMQLRLFEFFFDTFSSYCHRLELIRYDLAIDIPLPRYRVKMKRNSRCNYEYYYSEENSKEGLLLNSSVTEYQGRRNHNKFTKLYDKTKESKLDYDLTRIEFTFDRDELEFKNLPEFYIYDIQVSSLQMNSDNHLSDVQFVLVDLLRCSPDMNYYLKNLPYRIKKKIEPYLSDSIMQLDFNLVNKIRDIALRFEI